METKIMLSLIVMYFWLFILTVAFVIHWIKVERNLKVEKHMGTRVSEGLRRKVLGED